MRRKRQQKRTPKAKAAPLAATLADLATRLGKLEAAQRGAADYRRALAKQQQAQDALDAAKNELIAASKIFLAPYAAQHITWEYAPENQTGATTENSKLPVKWRGEVAF